MKTLTRTLMQVLLVILIATSAFAIPPGEKAPDFVTKDQDGKVIKLSDFKGKPLLLYFYPKDDTPGCTKEACSIRDEWTKFKKMGAVVYGVSSQDAESHKKFREKHKLPFDLLVDEDGKIAAAYGVGKMPIIGLYKRQSVLIGRDGIVLKFYEDVDPATHSQTVLKDIEATFKN